MPNITKLMITIAIVSGIFMSALAFCITPANAEVTVDITADGNIFMEDLARGEWCNLETDHQGLAYGFMGLLDGEVTPHEFRLIPLQLYPDIPASAINEVTDGLFEQCGISEGDPV